VASTIRRARFQLTRSQFRLTATRWLRKGIEDRAHCMPWLGIEPWTDPFRSDPRYASLLKEIGLTPIGAIAR
jgi:hypothetical protein